MVTTELLAEYAPYEPLSNGEWAFTRNTKVEYGKSPVVVYNRGEMAMPNEVYAGMRLNQP